MGRTRKETVDICVSLESLSSFASSQKPTTTRRRRHKQPERLPAGVDYPPNSRFAICLFVVMGLGASTVLAEYLFRLSNFSVFADPLALFLTFFAYEWLNVHSRAMSRQRRAFFDESNILETYQPRARTHGHLFVPDPPTPAATAEEEAKMAAEKNAFNATRDSHYANMFEYATRMAKEMEARQASIEASRSDDSETEVITSVAFDKDGKATASSSSKISTAASPVTSDGGEATTDGQTTPDGSTKKEAKTAKKSESDSEIERI